MEKVRKTIGTIWQKRVLVLFGIGLLLVLLRMVPKMGSLGVGGDKGFAAVVRSFSISVDLYGCQEENVPVFRYDYTVKKWEFCYCIPREAVRIVERRGNYGCLNCGAEVSPDFERWVVLDNKEK